MQKIICVANDLAMKGSGLRIEHGLSFWIETPGGIALFDSGGSEEVLLYNLKKLNLNPKEIHAIALSHGHNDHTGGLMALANGERQLTLPVYAHPSLLRGRFSRKEGKYNPITAPFSSETASASFDLRFSEKPAEILPGLWTTGEILNRTELEGRSAGHFIQSGNNYVPDPYTDDLSLVLKTGEGLVLICGCCHAGLLNTLFHVRNQFPEPIHTIVGGTHLISASGSDLRHIINVLSAEFNGASFYLNHCTGETAIQALAETFGNRVHPFPAGAAISFN